MSAVLAAVNTGSEAGIKSLVVSLIIVAVLAAFAYFGLRAVEQPRAASWVAAIVIILGVLFILL